MKKLLKQVRKKENQVKKNYMFKINITIFVALSENISFEKILIKKYDVTKY